MKLARINSHGKLTDPQDFQSVIAQYLSTITGRQALTAAMIYPIRRKLDYQGIAKQVFQIQQMPGGALPCYEREPPEEKLPVVQFRTGLQITNRGKLVERIYGRRVVIPTFEVFQNPTIRISDVKQRRFNCIDRAVQKARNQIMEQEDNEILKQLDFEGSDIVTSDSGNKKE